MAHYNNHDEIKYNMLQSNNHRCSRRIRSYLNNTLIKYCAIFLSFRQNAI